MSDTAGWVGVDLDGTLAEYTGWQGIEHIGKPVPRIVEHIQMLLRAGIEVKIFTARLQEGEEAVKAIEAWCKKHLKVILPITDKKDFSMVYALDDRIITVEANTGRMISVPPSIAVIRNHWNPEVAPPEEFRNDD